MSYQYDQELARRIAEETTKMTSGEVRMLAKICFGLGLLLITLLFGTSALLSQ